MSIADEDGGERKEGHDCDDVLIVMKRIRATDAASGRRAGSMERASITRDFDLIVELLMQFRWREEDLNWFDPRPPGRCLAEGRPPITVVVPGRECRKISKDTVVVGIFPENSNNGLLLTRRE
jgi:hypothetical protein